jgi:chromosome segregation ATPase
MTPERLAVLRRVVANNHDDSDFRALAKCLDEIERLQREQMQLLELVAVTCRDGGHYYTEHGTEKAVQHGRDEFYRMQEEIERLQLELAEMSEQVDAWSTLAKSRAGDIERLQSVLAEEQTANESLRKEIDQINASRDHEIADAVRQMRQELGAERETTHRLQADLAEKGERVEWLCKDIVNKGSEHAARVRALQDERDDAETEAAKWQRAASEIEQEYLADLAEARAQLATEVAVNADYPDVVQRMDRAEAEVVRLQAALAESEKRCAAKEQTKRQLYEDLADKDRTLEREAKGWSEQVVVLRREAAIAETRGWNAAVEACAKVAEKQRKYHAGPGGADCVSQQMHGYAIEGCRKIRDAIRALLKPTVTK